MTNKGDEAAPARDAEHRRWLISIAISVVFGIFSAVMAWLSYSARSKGPAPSAAPITRAPSVADGPDKRRRHKGN